LNEEATTASESPGCGKRLFSRPIVGVPALGFELLGERFDRTIVILRLAAFLVAAGAFGQVSTWGRHFHRWLMSPGLEIHSIRRSGAPGLSDDTSAVISVLSVRPSAG